MDRRVGALIASVAEVRTPRILAALALTALVATGSACSSSDSDGPGTTTSAQRSTTTAAEAAAPAYAERGEHQVGSVTVALADGRRVVIWYPAADRAKDQPTEIFDIASLLAPAMQAKIDADLRPQYEIDAHVGADPAEGGPFPVVVFSHGFAGFPEQSADLVTHLASWGFVVVAPDHVERSLSGLLGTAAQGVPKREDPEVLSDALDVALAQGEDPTSPLDGLLDADQVAVTGHSAGAGAAYLMASSDPRIKGFISYSVGTGQPDADGKVAERPVPKVPGMVMLGTADGIIPADDSRAVYEGMATPKHKVEIADAGHLVFSDICLIGKDQGGLVALTKEAGLDLPDQLLKLASDGCEDTKLDPSKAFAAIDHFSVAFLRSLFGIDATPVGLDQATADQFTTAEVTYEGDPG